MDRTQVATRTRRGTAPADIEALAWLLDSSIPVPGTRWRVGVDAIIGLVPGLGDLVSSGLGLLVVARAAQLGVPGIVLVQMLANVGLDLLTGLVPVVGDAFDAWYKANLRNVDLVRRHQEDPNRSTTGSWLFLGGLAAGLALLMVGIAWLLGVLLAILLR